MKKWTLSIMTAALLALSVPAVASTEVRANQSIWLGSGYSNWRAVSRDELILWAAPSRPYLIKIWRPVTSLRFVHAIGITSTAGRVTKFDKVIVDGQRLPIKSITPLDLETAKNMRWTG